MTQTSRPTPAQTIAAVQAALREQGPGFAFLSAEEIEKIAADIPTATSQTLNGYAEQIGNDASTNEACGNMSRADAQWHIVEAIGDIAEQRRQQELADAAR